MSISTEQCNQVSMDLKITVGQNRVQSFSQETMIADVQHCKMGYFRESKSPANRH
jgi:hypothetical protein